MLKEQKFWMPISMFCVGEKIPNSLHLATNNFQKVLINGNNSLLNAAGYLLVGWRVLFLPLPPRLLMADP